MTPFTQGLRRAVSVCNGSLGIALLLFLLAAADSPAGINQSNPGFPIVDLFGRLYDNNHYSATCVKCHDRTPSAHIPPLDNTRFGTHFVYGGSAYATRNTSWEKSGFWDTGALSRYGKVGDNVSATGVPGEMICESCHSLKKNTGKGKVVVADNESMDTSPLCEGCHAKSGPGHHLLTGETSTLYGRAMTTSTPSVIYPPVQPSTSEVTYPRADGVNCRSCHKPHRAQTSAGARALKRGYSAGPTVGAPVSGAGATGLERQFDVGPPPQNTPRLVTDFTPLCDACHTANQ